MNDNDNNYDFYFILNFIANIFQILDFNLNLTQLTNDDIMKHLLKQDKVLDNQNKVLDNQTNIYLKRIIEQNKITIEQNNKIIDILNNYINKGIN